MDISAHRFHHATEGTYETTVLTLPAHTATHVDLVLPGNRIVPERMVGAGKLVDVAGWQGRDIALADVEKQADPQEGDFVFFRTDWSRFAGADIYYEHPELSEEVIHWLISRKINAVGIDALGLGRDKHHGLFDRLLAEQGIFIIENLANLAAIPATMFRVYCLPLRIESVDAVPARVLVEI